MGKMRDFPRQLITEAQRNSSFFPKFPNRSEWSSFDCITQFSEFVSAIGPLASSVYAPQAFRSLGSITLLESPGGLGFLGLSLVSTPDWPPWLPFLTVNATVWMVYFTVRFPPSTTAQERPFVSLCPDVCGFVLGAETNPLSFCSSVGRTLWPPMAA